MNITSPFFAALLANGPVKAGEYTYFLYGGKIRKCKSKRGPRKSKTEREKQITDHFTEVRKIWKVYRLAIGVLPIWRVAARERGVSKSDSLFHSINGGCLQAKQGVWAFKTFRFSVGSLEAPVITNAERHDWTITLQWENGIEGPKAKASDQVFVGYFYDTLHDGPQLISNSMAHRGDGKVTIEIPEACQPEGTRLHLYLFFGNEELNQFSPSEYVEL